MYPGSASNNQIQHKAAKPLSFKIDPEDSRTPAMVTSPSVNITESDTEYLIALAVPGLVNSDFGVEIMEGVITISGNQSKQKLTGIAREEYDFSSWTRKFELPDDADALLAYARYRNGELTIRIPRGNTISQGNKATVNVY